MLYKQTSFISFFMSTSRPSWDVDWPPRQSNKVPAHERIGCPHEDQIPERQRGDDIQEADEDVGFWPYKIQKT